MIFVAGNVFSQNAPQNSAPKILFQNPGNPMPITVSVKNSVLAPATPVPFLSANYYASQLGFFCKQEIKFEKIVKVPVKFRLGSVEACDMLEGKQKVH